MNKAKLVLSNAQNRVQCINGALEGLMKYLVDLFSNVLWSLIYQIYCVRGGRFRPVYACNREGQFSFDPKYHSDTL